MITAEPRVRAPRRDEYRVREGFDVDLAALHEQFMAAESIGSFFHKQIRSNPGIVGSKAEVPA